MNLREQKLIWRIGKMRANLQAAQQRRKLEQAQAQHQAADDCACPVCVLKRAIAGAIATGTGAVRISAVDLMQPRDGPDETPKH